MSKFLLRFIDNPVHSINCFIACGKVNRVKRIVGGVETEVNEYPWQALLVFAGTKTLYCGGTLITDKHVLTAHHCVEE